MSNRILKVLIACEESQAVCKEFRALGHEAYSCDIQECSGGHPEWHINGDALIEAYSGEYDLMIAHPPCTFLTNAGIGYFNEDRYGIKAQQRKGYRQEAMKFFMSLYNAPVEKICVENPVGYPNSQFRRPDQVIHPYFFGDYDKKRTCLWLKNLPPLQHTKTDDLFSLASHVKEPKPLSVQIRKPGKYYKGGEIKKRYFTDVKGGGRGQAKLRSKTFPGIAKAMATQWSEYILNQP